MVTVEGCFIGLSTIFQYITLFRTFVEDALSHCQVHAATRALPNFSVFNELTYMIYISVQYYREGHLQWFETITKKISLNSKGLRS
jgi:hypothetical protein